MEYNCIRWQLESSTNGKRNGNHVQRARETTGQSERNFRKPQATYSLAGDDLRTQLSDLCEDNLAWAADQNILSFWGLSVRLLHCPKKQCTGLYTRQNDPTFAWETASRSLQVILQKLISISSALNNTYMSEIDEGGVTGGVLSSKNEPPDTGQFEPNSHWKNAPNRECYSSFGDNGTTATVNAYGNIMQISKYLGKGYSGMFSVDHGCVAKPSLVVQRTTDLQMLINKSVYNWDRTYGAHVPDLYFVPSEPELTFVHNRWPRIDRALSHDWLSVLRERGWKNDGHDIDFVRSDLSSFSRLSTTWMIHQGIVFQHCVVKNNSIKQRLPIDINFAGNMLIRDLDHLDPDNPSNNEEDDSYATFLGLQQRSWVRLHQLNRPQVKQNPEDRGNEEVMTDSVAVVVSLYIGSQVQSWSWTDTDLAMDNETVLGHSDPPSDDINAHVRPEETKTNWSHTVKPQEEVAFTFAYEMYYTQNSQLQMGRSFGHVDKSLIESVQKILGGETVEGTFSLSSSLPVIEEMMVPHWMFHTGNETEENESNQSNNIEERYTSRLEDPSGEILSRSPLNHLEFFTRRNLEHILSVCAIPIHSDDERIKGLEELDVKPVALTCGDMAFHRVNTGASFFAFEFLIETARRLQQPSISNHEQAKSLLDRVERVCIGHLFWLILIAQKCRPFAANYWVSGDEMDAELGWPWLPEDFPTDSAYQWIKVQECFDVFGKVLRRHKQTISNILQPAAIAWQEQLKFLDAKLDCAWRHAREDGINIFRLDDHIWIWRGLRAVECIEDSSHNYRNTINAWRSTTRQRETHQKAHDSTNVQQKVIQHFTTKNEALANRMLAVTRSARENHFLFHSRDTVLVYAYEWGFISAGDSNATEVWQNAMRAQPGHEENLRFPWESTLHYGLSILMALKGFSPDERPSSDIVHDSLAALTKISSPNGLFPGLLGWTTEKDDMFHLEEDRDIYFHAGFELSFILFRNAHGIIDSWNPKTGPSQKRYEIDQQKLIETFAQFITQYTLKGSLESSIAYVPDNVRTQSQRSTLRTSTMKKTIPVNRFIDADSVVNVDDEWLYNYPEFLASNYTAPMPFDLAVQKLRSVPRGTPEELEWLNRMLEKLPETTFMNSNPREKAVAVFDIAKKRIPDKRGSTKYYHPPMLDVKGLWTKLCSPRTAQSSKKRFVWLQSSEDDIALGCYLASHDDEKLAISMFFDRNAKAEQSFHDETSRLHNTWETELHLSFYQLFGSDNSTSNSKARLRGTDPTFPRNREYTVAKASIGFRFSGDFFDRFWTCHLIELTSEKHTEWDLWLQDPSDYYWWKSRKAWEQRKVLELHLFERILIALVDSTKVLFLTLKKTSDFSKFSGDWVDLQQSLKLISDDLERVDNTIVKWKTREIDRGAEQPRWTRNDERQYRGHINKLMVSTNVKIEEFRSLHSEIKSFRDWLTRYREQFREEAAFRGSENVKYFTYVTVVFLPLGFSTSVFSMSAVPEQDLVRRMATIAIIALMITVLAIMIAQNVKPNFDRMIQQLNAQPVETESATKPATNDTSAQSMRFLNVSQEALADEAAPNRSSWRRETDVAGSTNAGHQYYSLRRHSASDITIWLWYILTELPAKIVISAFRMMSDREISIVAVCTAVIAIIVLPWCLIALMARVIAVNLADLIHIISSTVSDTFDKILNSREGSQKPLKFLLEPSGKLRPLKAARDKLAMQGKGKAV